MPSGTGTSKDVLDLVGPGKRMTRGTKKKPPKKTGAMGTPKKGKTTKRSAGGKKRGK